MSTPASSGGEPPTPRQVGTDAAGPGDGAVRAGQGTTLAGHPLYEHLAAAAAALALASALAWPAVSTLASRLWGDSGDAWQNWWNGWWMAEALRRGVSPGSSELLWHPDGVDMWLHALAPLNSGLTALGQATLPGFAGYNLLVLLHLAFGVYGGFVLFRSLVGRLAAAGRLHPDLSAGVRWLSAFAGGAAFGLSPYTWAHVSVHLHVTSLGFVALFVHALLESLDRRGPRWPLLAALWAGASAACGWYLLVDEVIVGVVVLGAALLAVRRRGWRPVIRVTGAGLLSALAVLPLAVPTLRAQSAPVSGTHDPVVFSADWLSLWVPAPAQALGRSFLEVTGRFTGNSGENAGYLGYAALILLALALWKGRTRRLGILAVAGVVGLVLSFGPYLHVGGVVHRGVTLPYGWLRDLLPFLDGLGVPVRFALLFNLALGAGVAASLAWLSGRLAARALPTAVVVLAVLVPGALVVAEYAPSGQRTSQYPAPDWLRTLGDAGGPAGVADLTGWTHPLYNQTLHGRPIVHGYIARRPKDLEDALLRDPVLGAVYGEVLHGRATWRPALTRTDESLELDWGYGAPDPAVHKDFRVEWTGTLKAPQEGDYRFVLGSDDGATLRIGGRTVVDNGGSHPYREAAGVVRLTAGEHPVRLSFSDDGGQARLSLRWQPPGEATLTPVPTHALEAPDGRPGLRGRYTHRVGAPRLTGAEGRRHLREHWRVGWFVAYADREPWALRHLLGLREVAASDGMVLLEVPAD